MKTLFPHEYVAKVGRALEKLDMAAVTRAADLIQRAHVLHQHVWIVGNGGSAATAMHFANDLHKMGGISVNALPASIPTIMAYGNDNGWEHMFSDFLRPVFGVGDVLVAISCSGASPNVLNAAHYIREHDGKLIVLTGQNTNLNILAKMPGVLITVEDPDIKVQEDVHMVICHTIAGALAK